MISLPKNEINQKLLSFYQNKWGQISGILSTNEKISYPLILSVPDAYVESKTKLMIVGQQPYGWGFKKDVGRDEKWNSPEVLMQWHIDYYCGTKDLGSPFWQAAIELYHHLNPSGSPIGFITSNLIATDQWNNRPDDA